MSDTSNEFVHSRFTKGDKCILVHIAVTCLIILILVIIYVAHIFLVTHKGWDALRVTRRMLDQSSIIEAVDSRLEVPDYSPIGVAYINTTPRRLVCNTILVRRQWSLAPAHCLTIRSDPELSQYLPNWKLKYRDETFKETVVKRGIVHSYYNKDDFDNNIGLFEHMDHIQIPPLKFPEKTVNKLFKEDTEDLAIVGWKKLDEISSKPVQLLRYSKCAQFVSAVVDAPRTSELCVTQTVLSNIEGALGEVLLLNSQIVGFFSWGDRSGNVPQVILALQPYKGWVENMMTLTA